MGGSAAAVVEGMIQGAVLAALLAAGVAQHTGCEDSGGSDDDRTDKRDL